jgi:ketosteroid isomerase-like protein
MSQENVEVVKAAFARGSRGDFDGLLALFHPRVEWVEDPRVPGAITRRGHAEVKQGIRLHAPSRIRTCDLLLRRA